MIHRSGPRKKKPPKQKEKVKGGIASHTPQPQFAWLFSGLCIEKEHEISSHVYTGDPKELTLSHVSQWDMCLRAVSTLSLPQQHHTHISEMGLEESQKAWKWGLWGPQKASGGVQGQWPRWGCQGAKPP